MYFGSHVHFFLPGIFNAQVTIKTSSAYDSPAVYYQLGVDANADSYAEIGLMIPDAKGGLTLNTDLSSLNMNLSETATAHYSVLSTGRVTITIISASTDLISAAKILHLVDKNQAFFLDTGTNVGLGFVEPQVAVPSGGFATSSFSGTFSAATIAPSFGAIANATGLATLDGKGNFSETASLSATSGLFVKQTTTGTYSVAGNGRGRVTSLVITTAGIGGSLISLLFFLFIAPRPPISTPSPVAAGSGSFRCGRTDHPIARWLSPAPADQPIRLLHGFTYKSPHDARGIFRHHARDHHP